MAELLSSSPHVPLKNSLEASFSDDDTVFEWDLKSLVNLPQFSDVVFFVGSSRATFFAHRPILAARSNYFASLFKIGPTLPLSVELPHISPPVFRAFLEFLYTNALKYVDGEAANDVFTLARQYQVPSLELYKRLLYKESNRSHLMNRLPSLGSELARVLNVKEYSDVTFLVEGVEFHASRAILSARSVYFSSLFCGSWKELAQNEIRLEGVLAESFRAVLCYVYTDSLPNSPSMNLSTASDLMQLSSYYGIPGLRDVCQRFFSEHISAETVCETWMLAVAEDLKKTAEDCLKFFLRNFGHVVATSSFLSLSRSLLRAALASGEICDSADVILSGVLRWGQANCPAGEDVRMFVQDLLPPETLFNAFNKMYLLGKRPVIF